MPDSLKPTVEVRLIVIVIVNLADLECPRALAGAAGKSPSIVETVVAEVTSNLESVSYIDDVIVSPL